MINKYNYNKTIAYCIYTKAHVRLREVASTDSIIQSLYYKTNQHNVDYNKLAEAEPNN